MAIIKCKSCGGDLIIRDGETVAECEFCGVKQTLPKGNDEVLQSLFNRANALRLRSEFDKAEQLYEKILQENERESEAHWGIVLCKYGIEYVEDPKTFKRVPTCHRTSYDAVTTDPDYLAALENADAAQRAIYEAEAKAIDEIQKGILRIAKDEQPFDVFICYKETDENGNRTIDSVVANDIYYQLTQEGLKVFYAAITLEDKLGTAYEPYIFAALSSAKVMLAIGTKPQYFTAVWVKNEWSRFLRLMKTDRNKLLIPCYKNMDAYELPEEFAHLQAQDMGKIGFINDIVRGIKKVTNREEPKAAAVQTPVAATAVAGVDSLLKRAFSFLEDGDWSSANEYCERVLDIDPENAKAYLCKLLAELHLSTPEKLGACCVPFVERNNYAKVMRYADEPLRKEMQGYVAAVKNRMEAERIAREKREEEARIAQRKREEDARIAQQKREEKARLARQIEEEKERKARQRMAEAERIAREKREEEDRIAREKQEEDRRIADAALSVRKKRNIPLLLIWLGLVALSIVIGSIVGPLIQTTTVADSFGRIIANCIMHIMFTGLTLLLTFLALLFAAVKRKSPKVTVIVSRVFAILGVLLCSLVVVVGLSSAELSNPADVDMITSFLSYGVTNAICFAVLFFRKK